MFNFQEASTWSESHVTMHDVTVLPFEGFPPMTKQVTNSFFILNFTPYVSAVLLLTVIIQRTQND